MSALYPAAHVDLLLPESTSQPKITPRLIILHTNAGSTSTSPSSLRAYMARTDVNVECHFDIGTQGDVWQFMPCDVRADCNYQANPFAISIETQDQGSATLNTTPWSGPQVEAIVKLLAWLRDTYSIPMVRCTSWDGSGVGAHRDFSQWSVSAHSCPGEARFAQVPDIIALASMHHPPQPEEPSVAYFRDDRTVGWQIWLQAVDAVGNAWACPINDLPDGGKWQLVQPLVGDPPVRSFAALAALMDAQNRPTPIPSTGFHDHTHSLTPSVSTGGVVP